MAYGWAMIVMLIQKHVSAYQDGYLGCYELSEDINITQSLLKNYSGHECVSFCFPRYRYAGTKEDKCYCGNNTVGHKVEDDLCDYDCPDVRNNVVKCGDRSRLSLYDYVRFTDNVTTPALYTVLLPSVVVMVNIVIVGILLNRYLKNRLTIRIVSVTDTEHAYDELSTLPTRADFDEQSSRSQNVYFADDVIDGYESPVDDNEENNEVLEASCAVDRRLRDVILQIDDTYSHIPIDGLNKKDQTPRQKRTVKSKSGLKTYKVDLSKSGKVKICEKTIPGCDDQGDGLYDTIQTNRTIKYRS